MLTVKEIADASPCTNVSRFGGDFLRLLTQAVNGHIHYAKVSVKAIPPNFFDKLLSADSSVSLLPYPSILPPVTSQKENNAQDEHPIFILNYRVPSIVMNSFLDIDQTEAMQQLILLGRCTEVVDDLYRRRGVGDAYGQPGVLELGLDVYDSLMIARQLSAGFNGVIQSVAEYQACPR